MVELEVAAAGISVRLSGNGEVAEAVLGEKGLKRTLRARAGLEGCSVQGEVTSRELSGGGAEFTSTLVQDATGNACQLVQRFTPTVDSIRWEVEITGSGDPWSAELRTVIEYPASEGLSFWAPWGDAGLGDFLAGYDGSDFVDVEPTTTDSCSWSDPLVLRSLRDATLWYGAPYFTYEAPCIAFMPFRGDLICIPMASLLEEAEDLGLSVILSPEDDTGDLALDTAASGRLTFRRLRHRISARRTLRFAADLVAHEADWRGGLRWMTARYPEYFEPANPLAHEIAGAGAYSDVDAEFDAEKMRKMSFSVNWRASFDFPYMGMFLPPVPPGTAWPRFGGGKISVTELEAHARRMRDLGFHVLSYFNVAEFGTGLSYPPPPRRTVNDADLWEDPADFTYGPLRDAILPVPERVKGGLFYQGSKPGEVYHTWNDAFVLDCGEPVYREFLLDQARRHIEEIPSAFGICIDRMDWMRLYNEARDDGVSWFEDRPVRSLAGSWRRLMAELAPMMHEANKVIFVNNHYKRLDLLRGIDGIFDEFTYSGAPLNTTAFLCVKRPAMGWVAFLDMLKVWGADHFFQKFLHLGVFPMAPFPGNDHSLQPDPWGDQQYLDYGPLLNAMHARQWVLEPHCVSVEGDAAKVNLFEVPGGYALPVTYTGDAEMVTVTVRNVPGLSEETRCEVLHPGVEEAQPVATSFRDGVLELQVPVVRGCAMVRINV